MESFSWIGEESWVRRDGREAGRLRDRGVGSAKSKKIFGAREMQVYPPKQRTDEEKMDKEQSMGYVEMLQCLYQASQDYLPHLRNKSYPKRIYTYPISGILLLFETKELIVLNFGVWSSGWLDKCGVRDSTSIISRTTKMSTCIVRTNYGGCIYH